MTTSTKPILHNGFEIRDGLSVNNRVERVFFTDVYELSDGSFFYLFHNLKPNEVNDRRERYDLVRIEKDNKEWIGVVVKEHSVNNLSGIVKNLTTVRGFDAIAGMNDLKNLLISEVINPLLNPEKFEKFKVSIPNGIILHGPPGCGKTFIVRKLAEELGYNFFEVKHSDLATPYIHGAVGNIGKVFENAKQKAPAIIFFDEISGLVPDRRRSQDSSYKEEEVNEFLIQLNDAADNKVLVVGATNYIDRIDPAVLRPGRFDKKIHVPPPDFEARKELFKLGLAGRPHDEKLDFDKLAMITEGYSSADIIEGIVESAARLAANLDKYVIDQEILEAEAKKKEDCPRIGFAM
ncbi:MAG: ATP-binding protein [Candidatus Paceibacterota bacterium]